MRLEAEFAFVVHLPHLTPRVVDHLTVAEFQRHCLYAEELNRRAKP